MCWGSGLYGQLGHESTDDLGDEPGEMSALRPVYLGAGKTAIAVSVGFSHSCAILNDHTLKCWGMGADGRLGYDSTDNKGDDPGEMGLLGTVFLGPGKSALAVSAGAFHTCTVLNDHSVKCWGFNAFGQLGQDSTESLGDDSGEMADLKAINLGASALAVAAGTSHTCALLQAHTVKCWGNGLNGRLGYDAVDSLGDAPGEMALLLTVDLGAGKTAMSISVGDSHSCVVLSNGKAKCWGGNQYGQLGQDSSDDIGDEYGEMSTLSTIRFNALSDIDTAVEVSAGCEHSAQPIDVPC